MGAASRMDPPDMPPPSIQRTRPVVNVIALLEQVGLIDDVQAAAFLELDENVITTSYEAARSAIQMVFGQLPPEHSCDTCKGLHIGYLMALRNHHANGHPSADAEASE